MTCRLRWCVEKETRCRIPIWRTFEGIEWHVIPQLRVTLQGAGTWWIHCHDSRATCHIAGCSHLTKSVSWSCHIAGCKNSIWHIKNRFSPYFLQCSLGFDERLLSYRLRYTCLRYSEQVGICVSSVVSTSIKLHQLDWPSLSFHDRAKRPAL